MNNSNKKKIDFSTAIVLLDKDKFLVSNIIKTDESDFQLNINSNVYLIKSQIIDNKYLWVSAEYGDLESYSSVVYNTTTNTKELNPKDKFQAELLHQFFALFDFTNNKLYISDQRKFNFFAIYIKKLTNKECNIYREVGSSEEIINRLTKLTEIKLTIVDDLFKKDILSPDVQTILDESSTLNLELKYDVDLKNNKGLFGALQNLINKKTHYKKIVIMGTDEDNDKNIFNLNTVVVKRTISCKKKDNNKVDPDDVLHTLLEELKKNVHTPQI